MLASDITTRAARLLQDEGYTRWTQAELLQWTGDAQEQIAAIRPDAHVTEAPFALVAGADQSVPETVVVDAVTYTVTKLLDIKHNIRADSSAGKAVTFTDHNALSRFDKLWKTRAKKKEADNWMHDNRFPKRFMVQPPNNGDSGMVMCEFATVPPRPSVVTDELALDNRWRDAVIAYVMFRCYAKDAEHTARAGEYGQMFASLMGLDGQASRAYSPQIAESGGMPNLNLLGQGGV